MDENDNSKPDKRKISSEEEGLVLVVCESV